MQLKRLALFIKFTADGGQPCNGGSGQWGLPRGKRPGRWWNIEGDLKPCSKGLHLCREQDLLRWLGPVMWVAQADGEIIKTDAKVVARRARLILRVPTYTDRALRLFACDEAERALDLHDSAGDPRSRRAVEVARRYANGEAAADELAAAYAAACAAASAAAYAAARYAAYAAACAAASAAAYAAARYAAYAAAYAAARYAAYAAARAAASAAASAAARDAARDAASAAAKRLVKSLNLPRYLREARAIINAA